MDSNLLHKESDEAMRQLAKLEGQGEAELEGQGYEVCGERSNLLQNERNLCNSSSVSWMYSLYTPIVAFPQSPVRKRRKKRGRRREGSRRRSTRRRPS